MKVLNGKGVYSGIAIGKLRFFERDEINVRRISIDNPDKEKERFEKAKRKAINVLMQLYDKAKNDIGESGAQIFEIHRMMLEDEDYNESILNIIDQEKVNAEFAVATTQDTFAQMFSEMDDSYMQARATDVIDVSNRLIRILIGKNDSEETDGNADMIICADDLAPSETMQLDKEKVIAFVTAKGSINSHTSILARSMGIPAIVDVGEELFDCSDNETAIVDGSKGVLYIEPDREVLSEFAEKQEEETRAKNLLDKYKGLENITLDGKKIEVYANIQGLSDIGLALKNDAGGIGLFRSEFLYLGKSYYPDESEQFLTYKKALQSMGKKKVVIRTLDIGADKQIDYFLLDKEENPALGMRAIRICLTRPGIFKTQLRALYRASLYGNLAIMFPMITSCREVDEILGIVSEVKEELSKESLAYSESVELGIMIETPAAAIISDKLAEKVDFFSIGTNDLTQYTLAIDRQNIKLSKFYDPHHEAILALIEMTVENAHKHGKWVGICGELGADLTLTERFLKMGIDELSVSPSYILPLRDKIRNTELH